MPIPPEIRTVEVAHAKTAKFTLTPFQARTHMEACEHCETLAVGLYVIVGVDGTGYWICPVCKKVTEVSDADPS